MGGELIAYFNGEYLPERDVHISIEDRAFKYGDMAFDVARTFQGSPFKLERHMERLFRSVKFLGIAFGHSRAEFSEITMHVLERNLEHRGEGDYWLRQYVSRGIDPPSHRVHDAGQPTVLVRCEPLPFPSMARGYENGVEVRMVATRRIPAVCVDPKAKTANYLNSIIAELEGGAGVIPLMLDTNGYVAEAGMMNFFIVSNGIVKTAPLGSILPGISRETVLELSRREGIPVYETDLTPHDVLTADEAFVTGTSFCIMRVGKVNGTEIADGRDGEVTARLLEAWKRLVEFDFVEQAMKRQRSAAAPAGSGA